jgi:hypothetical protein
MEEEDIVDRRRREAPSSEGFVEGGPDGQARARGRHADGAGGALASASAP